MHNWEILCAYPNRDLPNIDRIYVNANMHQLRCHDIRSPNLPFYLLDSNGTHLDTKFERSFLKADCVFVVDTGSFWKYQHWIRPSDWIRDVFSQTGFPNVSSCSISFSRLLSDLPFSKVLSLVQICSIKGHGVQKVQPIVLQKAECSFVACHDDGMGVLMGASDNVIEVRGVICLQSRMRPWPWQK